MDKYAAPDAAEDDSYVHRFLSYEDQEAENFLELVPAMVIGKIRAGEKEQEDAGLGYPHPGPAERDEHDDGSLEASSLRSRFSTI